MLQHQIDKLIDTGYWILALLLFLAMGLFPEQIVEFWSWFVKSLWLILGEL